MYGSSSDIHLQRKVNNEPLYKVMAVLEEKALRKELTGAALEKEVTATLQQFATNKELSLQR